ncbi:6533_t:CDS:2 [Funneliformis caledonium]|uniref:6533_t:CDS:1 n=1 Tax=Funneliformis caledonium TaxID=1117310 RepID=A0A9N9FHH4_9GLOM|nr:6533_t:CDS:2 [Funneliformis caledonium]
MQLLPECFDALKYREDDLEREEMEHSRYKGELNKILKYHSEASEIREEVQQILRNFQAKQQNIYMNLKMVEKRRELLEKEQNSHTVLQPPTQSAKVSLCIDDILRRIKNIGPVVDNNETMRCEYISTILHTAVSLLDGMRNIRGNNLHKPKANKTRRLWVSAKTYYNVDMNVNMNKKKRKIDDAFDPDPDYVFGIVSTGTDWYVILHSTEGIYCTSRTEYRISLTKMIRNVKRVLEVIVGLLKDRIVGSEEPATKKRRVEEIIKKR